MSNRRRALESGLFVHLFFFFNDTATTEIYTLSLHDALPIFVSPALADECQGHPPWHHEEEADRKSTRLNSSHSQISYAVFCLKKRAMHTGDLSEPKRKAEKDEERARIFH